MSDESKNRRKFARVPLETHLRIVLAGSDDENQNFLENLSIGGLFIRTNSPKPIGTRVRFEFVVGKERKKVAGLGVVQWVKLEDDANRGMGVRFVELTREGEQGLRQALKRKIE
jgi:uncharacterized protein (TIGR02266 family)